MSALKERKTRKWETGYWKNWYDTFVCQIIHNVQGNKCQCQWATDSDTIFKTMAPNKESKN